MTTLMKKHNSVQLTLILITLPPTTLIFSLGFITITAYPSSLARFMNGICDPLCKLSFIIRLKIQPCYELVPGNKVTETS
jgi:hypothetical protein